MKKKKKKNKKKDMTYYRAQWWDFVKTATNLRFPIKSDVLFDYAILGLQGWAHRPYELKW
jgi:hypothetical protein